MSFQVRHSFDERFMSKIKDIESKYGLEMLELDGIGPTKLDINQFAKSFFSNNAAVADVSIDGNGNVDDSSVLSFEYEFTKSIQKLNSYYLIWKEMVNNPELGIKRANRCLELLINGELKLHDAHGVSKPYCYAFDLEPLVTNGMPFINKINIGPPKHFSSFINLVIQFTAFSSNQIMGAAAFPNLWVYADWFARKDFGEDYLSNPEHADTIKQNIQSLIYSFNFPFRGSQSSFVNLNMYDKYFMEDMFGDMYYNDGTKPDLESVDKLQKFYMEWFVKESEEQTFTFPVNTATFYKNSDGDIVDDDFLDYISELNCVNGVFNIFTGELGVLSSCCRLRNDSNQVQYQNSFGAAGVSIGSVRVCTLNLPSISYQSESISEFMKKLEYNIGCCQDILESQRDIVTRNIGLGKLPLYNHKFMDLSKQFMTLGHIGMYEALEQLGLDIMEESGEKLAARICRKMSDLMKNKTTQDSLIRNVEAIPGESAAVKLALKDKIRFNHKYTLYSNQYIPLIKTVDIHDRIRVHGALDHLGDGGGILHINSSDALTKDQMKNLIKFAAKSGNIYFAVNMLYCRCSTCGKLYIGKFEKSPCHNASVSYYIRVVGFMVRVDDWIPERREEFKDRQIYSNGGITI